MAGLRHLQELEGTNNYQTQSHGSSDPPFKYKPSKSMRIEGLACDTWWVDGGQHTVNKLVDMKAWVVESKTCQGQCVL